MSKLFNLSHKHNCDISLSAMNKKEQELLYTTKWKNSKDIKFMRNQLISMRSK